MILQKTAQALLLLLLILLPKVGSAQYQQQTGVDLHVGMTLNSLNWNPDFFNTGFLNDAPEVQYKPHLGIGMGILLPISKRIYGSFNADYLIQRFTVATDGLVSIQQRNGQNILVMADYIDYKYTSCSVSGNFGWVILPHVSLESGLFFRIPIGNSQDRVENFPNWSKSNNVNLDPDVGLLGGLRFSKDRWFVSARYHHGFSSFGNIFLNDPVGLFFASARLEVRSFFFSIGYFL